MAVFAPQWERRYSRKLIWTDTAVVLFSTALGVAVASRRYWGGLANSTLSPDDYALGTLLIAAIYALVWLIALDAYASRQPVLFGTGPAEYSRVLTATLMGYGLITITFFVFGVPLQRSFVYTSLPLGLVLLVLGRWVWRKRLHQQRRRSRNTYRTLLVGERAKCVHTAKQLHSNRLAGFDIIGAATSDSDKGSLMAGVDVVSDYDGILDAIEAHDIDTLIMTGDDSITPERLRRLSWELESREVDLIVATALTDVAGPRIHTRPVSGLPLLHIDYPKFEGSRYFAKHAFDLFGALVGLIVLSPLFLVITILIRIDSPGRAIFKQQRLGMRGKPFTMYKFRSMQSDAELELPSLLDQSDGQGVLFKMQDDPRITRLGKFMRRHSIDELPQLINVLRGEMSLVGPRPPLQREFDQYEDWVNRRLFVRPGMSGLWQVSGRSHLTWDESVRLDLYYVENWSMTGDLLILWRTFRAVFKSEGAY